MFYHNHNVILDLFVFLCSKSNLGDGGSHFWFLKEQATTEEFQQNKNRKWKIKRMHIFCSVKTNFKIKQNSVSENFTFGAKII